MITSYVVIPYIGSTAQTPTIVAAPATSTTITGMAAGTTYTFKVAAVNAIGQGPESTASNAVTPTNLAVDLLVTTHQTSSSTSISSPAFSTAAPSELLLAFITSDGPSTRHRELLERHRGRSHLAAPSPHQYPGGHR